MEKQKAAMGARWLTVTAAILATSGGLVLQAGIAWPNGLQLALLFLLLLYLHSLVPNLGQITNFPLSTSAFFPIIFLYGPAPALLMGALTGIFDGFIYKKSFQRLGFNVLQLSVSALVGSSVFQLIKGSSSTVGVQGVLGIALGALTYIITNVFLVSLKVSRATGRTFWFQISQPGIAAFYSSLGMGFVGVIFTLFIYSYGLGGLIAFGLFLIHLSNQLKLAGEVEGVRTKRLELEEELLLDKLTGAKNFRYLNQWLDEANDEQAAVLFLDIDNFKEFNDHLGHSEGDELLKALVESIRGCIRAGDRVVRYGGDEFVILLMQNDAGGARRVAEHIAENFQTVSVTNWDRCLTVSIGIATTGSGLIGKRQLLLRSDQAMYVAKDSGKNTIRFWQAQKGPC